MAAQVKAQKTESTVPLLIRSYNSARRRLREATEETDQADALILQKFLADIKNAQLTYQKNGKEGLEGLWETLQYGALIKAMYEIHSPVIERLNLISGADSSYLLGAQLERGLSSIIKSVETVATGKSYDEASHSIVGGYTTQVPDLINTGDDIMKGIFNDIYNQTAQAMREYAGTAEKHTGIAYMNAVQGKIDNVGLSGELVISSSVNIPNLETVVNALKNATFSDKNYISTSHLRLGMTNPFRVFLVMVASGYKGAAQFYRMVSCFENHLNDEEGQVAFYRIRAIYELTGLGLKYKNSEIANILVGAQAAKFFVYNNPFGHQNSFGGIYVVSTRKLVNKMMRDTENLLPKGWQDALFGPIELQTKTYFDLGD